MTTARVTPQWLAQQVAKATAPVVEGWRDGVLSIFVPGTPYNFKSASALSMATMMKHRRLVKEWRQRTGERLYRWRRDAVWRRGVLYTPWPWRAAEPKRVHFTVYCRNPFDGVDGLRVVCSPSTDALKDMGLIDDDRDSSRHAFTHEQQPSRKRGSVYGIAVTVEARR